MPSIRLKESICCPSETSPLSKKKNKRSKSETTGTKIETALRECEIGFECCISKNLLSIDFHIGIFDRANLVYFDLFKLSYRLLYIKIQKISVEKVKKLLEISYAKLLKDRCAKTIQKLRRKTEKKL